jgi:hypothetical protein
MSQKNEVRHNSNGPITVKTTVKLLSCSSKVPSQKRKEEAKPTLYLNRV